MAHPYSNIYQVTLNPHLQDLNPVCVGISREPSTANTLIQGSTTYTLIHYVLEGKGTYYVGNRAYPVRAGQAFLRLPNQVASHKPDPDDPWSYRWIGFTGAASHRFAELPAVFDIPEAVTQLLCDPGDPSNTPKMLEYRLAAELFLLYSLLLDPKEQKRDYAQLVMDHVQSFYMDKLSIEQIANQLGLNRSYLSDLFKKKTGTSIQNYILNVRITAAKQMMMHGSSVKEAATSCGFNDISNFTKLFTKVSGKTPTAWKKTVLENTDISRKEYDGTP